MGPDKHKWLVIEIPTHELRQELQSAHTVQLVHTVALNALGTV